MTASRAVPNASAEATSLTVPSPPHATISDTPLVIIAAARSRACPPALGHEDFGVDAAPGQQRRSMLGALTRGVRAATSTRNRVDDDCRPTAAAHWPGDLSQDFRWKKPDEGSGTTRRDRSEIDPGHATFAEDERPLCADEVCRQLTETGLVADERDTCTSGRLGELSHDGGWHVLWCERLQRLDGGLAIGASRQADRPSAARARADSRRSRRSIHPGVRGRVQRP
jgi:hypothetical protein